jgi:hypothetical protein
MALTDRPLPRAWWATVQELGHQAQLVPRTRREHAASGDDGGPTRVSQDEGRLADGRRIRARAQVRIAAGARPETGGGRAIGREHVVRTAHERRARSTARGQLERPRRQLGDPLGAVQAHGPLGDRAKEREVIDFLDRIPADGRGVHIIDHRHHGNR